MSLILEALKRSEDEREARASSSPSHRFERDQRRRLWPWLLAGFLIVNAAGIGAYFRLGSPPEPKPEPVAPEMPVKAEKPQPAPEPPSQAIKSKPKPKAKEKTAGAGHYFKRAGAFEKEGLYKRAIEEYTRAILLKPAMAEAYLGRGWAQEAMGNHESAARNFTRAIEIDAKMADAYFGRGWANERRGRVKQAIKDYGRAIRQGPGGVDAYFSRGILNFYGGHMAAAADDFTAVLKKADGSLRHYAFLWLYLSRARQGDSLAGQGGLIRVADMAVWPGVIVSYYRGRKSAKDVLDAAQDADPQRQKEKESVAFFFLGQYELLQGDEDGAADYFRKTLAAGVTTYRQYGAARRELQRLGLL